VIYIIKISGGGEGERRRMALLVINLDLQ
jgi:hypothetical protein